MLKKYSLVLLLITVLISVPFTATAQAAPSKVVNLQQQFSQQKLQKSRQLIARYTCPMGLYQVGKSAKLLWKKAQQQQIQQQKLLLQQQAQLQKLAEQYEKMRLQKIAEQDQKVEQDQKSQQNQKKQQTLSSRKTEKTSAKHEKGQLLGTFKLTFYCADCDKSGTTASGATPTFSQTVAVDKTVISLGSKIYIEGYGSRIAQDTGGAIKGKRLDIYIPTKNGKCDCNTHGVKYAKVYK
ncbi:MAG: 3D domain-containing protein [Bacillota bacterium]